jgi:dienelactone hydrolase
MASMTHGKLSHIPIATTLLWMTVSAPVLRAEDLWREVESLRPQDVSAGRTAVLDNLERRAREALAAIAHPRDARDADQRREPLRRELERSLGIGRLPWPPTLRPRTIGTLRRDGYRLEKVVYESLPGSVVPAHLYLPEGLDRRAPAVLMYPGHWWPDSKSSTDFQVFCINMARLGFVVLNFDPFGQGERGVSARDHRRTETLLVGVAQQGIAEYETRCALEYLLARPEVDRRRVGITGASGGGYNTWITTALDDRIAAAVAVVGTSDFAEQIHVCRPLDWFHAAEHCHFVPGLIRYANNHELLAMSAPKPLLIINAVRDKSFPLAGVRAVAEYGRVLYASYGAEEKTGLVVDEKEGHGYQRLKREAAYGWFLRWLAGHGDGRPYPEAPAETHPFDAEELRCFPPGQNEPAGPAIMEMVRSLAQGLPPSPPRIDLEAVLGPPPPAPPGRVTLSGERLQRLLIPSEEDLTIPAFLLRPAGEVRGLVVAVDDRGKEALASDPVVEEAVARGWAVCGVDPRGLGELAVDEAGWAFAVSLLLGENLVGRQAWDLGRVLETVGTAASFRGKPHGLYARGPNASLAATYAIAQAAGKAPSPLRWYLLRDGFVSYHAFIDRPRSLPESYRLLREDRDRMTGYDREIPAAFFPFEALRAFDLPQLLAASPAEGLVVDPIDGDRERLPVPAARAVLPARVGVVLAEELGEKFGALLQSSLDQR